MDNIADNFIRFHEQFRVLHWQTKSYARHKAYGGIFDSFTGLIDAFIECHMGKYGRITVGGSIQLSNLNDVQIKEFIAEVEEFLVQLNESCDSVRDSDLLNIRDEMLAEINKLKYLLTLE
jgi:hypothetical protein